MVPEPAVEVDSLPDLVIVVAIMSSVLSSVLVIRDTVKPPIWRGHCREAAIWRGLLFRGYICYTLRLLLLTGSNFSDFAILFTFRVLILAILDFNHKTH